MGNARAVTLAAALAAFLAAPTLAGVNQWTIVGPPIEVRAMAIDPHDANVLYAAGFHAVAKSTDRGATWTVTPIDGLGLAEAIEVSTSVPSTVYALGFGTLYRSTDAGLTWTARTVPTAAQFQMDLAVHPLDSRTLVLAAANLCFLGCQNGGVYRSTDGGASWKKIGLTNKTVMRVVLDPFSSSVIYAISENTLYRTHDGGRSWFAIANDASDIAVDSVVPSLIYVSTRTGLYRSPDAGTTWTLVRASEYQSLVATPKQGPSRVFATASGTALSLDRAESWREISRLSTGWTFSTLWQVAVTEDTCYMVSDLQLTPGQIFAYELRLPRRRSVRQ